LLQLAAGGIYDGRGLAMALSFGAQAVWVGTRFVCAKEAGAPPRHQQAIINAGPHDTVRTIIFTGIIILILFFGFIVFYSVIFLKIKGRPMRVVKSDYIMNWENNRYQEIKELTSQVSTFLILKF
jgi:hypothetical protein